MRADSFSANPYNYSVLHSQQSEALKNNILDQGAYQQQEFSDKDSACSVIGLRNRRGSKNRNSLMKSAKGITKKGRTMDYTNYNYNEAVGRLKIMLAESYVRPKNSAYMRNLYEDPADNFSDSISVIERPVLSDISKYLSPSQKARLGVYRPKKTFSNFSTSKENLMNEPTATTASSVDYYTTIRSLPQHTPVAATNNVPAPVEIFDFIEKQEDYIEQLEKESKYCRGELSNLLEKVKDVINENEILTETARTEIAALSGYDSDKMKSITASSESDENLQNKICTTLRRRSSPRSPRYANAPKIVFEARISELEAELMQTQIDLKRFKQENEELKRKLANADPISTLGVKSSINCDSHRKQIEHLQQEKTRLEGTVLKLQQSLDDAKSEHMNGLSSKRYVNELMQMERSQAELEVKHLRDELDRQHERVRELQHEMTRRVAEERSNAERRYNNQVDQLGGDLSSQWEQVTKLQLELERQKRYESDLKRDLTSRNAQIEELKMELRSNRSTFLADMAQINAEKQSIEQEITALRLQLDRGAREHKTEAARLNAEINSLRQRLDRGDADLLHSKREVLRLNDEIANLEKELAYGEMKNEIRPTKKDLDKRISEMQDKHAETVNELEEMIQSQKQLMDKLTKECRILTKKLEDTTIKNKTEISSLQSNVEYLTNRMINSDTLTKLDISPSAYNSMSTLKAPIDYKSSTFGTSETALTALEDYSTAKQSPYTTAGADSYVSTTPASISAVETSKYENTNGKYNSGSNNNNYGRINENEEENLKDRIESEKQRDVQPASKITTDNENNQEYGVLDSSQAQLETNLNTEPLGPGDYNTEYTGYEDYGQQQYDVSGYEGVYDGNQQYDTTQVYGDSTAEGGAVDPYNNYATGSTDYNQTAAYQYDTTTPTTSMLANTESVSSTSIETAIAPGTKSSTSSAIKSGTSLGGATIPARSSTTESRTQSRAGNSAMGSTGTTGAVGGGKSQQSSSSTAKK